VPETCVFLGLSCQFAGTLATWVAVIGAIGAVWVQGTWTRRTLSAEVFTRLNERWDSPTFRARRRVLAMELGSKKAEDVAPALVEDVIDFFEDLGVMLRKKWIDEDSCWNSFASSARHYWKACGETYVVDYRRRAQDATYFSEFEFLKKRMDEVEKQKRGKSTVGEIELTSTNVKEFLAIEVSLS
jgi:hypothetical protein